MKKILKISLLTVSASMLLFSSCLKETFPTDLATTEQIGQSPIALQSLVDAVPASMVQANSTGYAASGNGWDFALPGIHVSLESMTGDLIITGEAGYDHFSQWGRGYAIGDSYAVGAQTWHNYYSWIKNAHGIMQAINEDEATQTQRQYLGYAYAFRAMSYLDLVRIYEFKENKYTTGVSSAGNSVLGLGVPLVTEKTTEEEAKNNPRAKVEDIYTLIFADLEKAEALFEGFKNPNKYTIGKAYVYGLMARAYLERGTAGVAGAYEKAASYARKAITESGGTPLTQAQWQDPKTGFNDASSNNSWIWAIPLPSESVYNLYNFTAHMSTEESWTSYGWRVGRGINRLLYERIPLNDFRKYSWLDPDRDIYEYQSCRPDGNTHFRNSLKSYANIKFRPAQGVYNDYNIGGAADHVCMRVEEMYFIEAEATAYSNLGSAKTMLNDFMKYRITDGSYDCSAITSVDAFVEELMFQKRVEFWGEGIVFFDMKRLNMSNSRGYVGTNSPANYRLNHDGRAPYWNFVIIRSETNNNPAIKDYNNPDPSSVITPWIE